MSQRSILIIDDEQDIREAMADALKQRGHQVYTAENGETGLTMALANKPDLILLDLVMPELDGHKTLEKLRQDHWGKSAKVVVLSGMDDVKNVATAHEGKITDYLIKSNASLSDIAKKAEELLYLAE